MNVLVTAASEHCSTSGIARPIADDLGAAGHIVNPRHALAAEIVSELQLPTV